MRPVDDNGVLLEEVSILKQRGIIRGSNYTKTLPRHLSWPEGLCMVTAAKPTAVELQC